MLEKRYIMSKTINGLELREVFEKLQADLPQEAIQHRDYDDIKYISVDTFRRRLDDVVGPEHYNEYYSDIELIQAKDTYAIKCKCKLEFLDDNFDIILVKESAGGNTLAFPKIDEKITSIEGNVRTTTTVKNEDGKNNQIVGTTINSIPNDLDSACQDAFKRICKKQLGIGRRQLELAGKGTLYVVFVKSYRKADNGGHVFCDIEWDGKPYKFVCWAKQVTDLESVFGTQPLRGKVIAFYGKESKDPKGNPQLVFAKPGEVPSEYNNASNTANEAAPNSQNASKPNNKPETPKQTTQVPQPQTSPTEATAPTAEASTAANGRKVITFKSRSALTALTATGYEGSYKMDCDLNGSNVKVFFLTEYINQMNQQKWNDFKNQTSKKFISFTVECCEKNGSYYVANFK